MRYFAACLCTGAALAVLASAASAADVPADRDWSGFYAGLQGGYATGQSDSVSQGFDEAEVDHEGGVGGFYYGRNWQSGNLVFGLDGSTSVSSIEGEFEFTAGFSEDMVDTNVDLFSASRVRAGYAFDNILVFAAAGASVAHVDGEYIDDLGVVLDEDEEWLMGFTVGAGVEAKFTQHLSARLEYLYINYGDDTIAFEDITEPSEIDLDLHIVRGGIAYHF